MSKINFFIYLFPYKFSLYYIFLFKSVIPETILKP